MNTTGGFSPEGIGFAVELAYYRYAIGSAGSTCFNTAGGEYYRLQAFGDLDGDGTQSLFEQAAGSNSNNELYRSKGFFVQNETE
jgi:hypothetical protein